MTNPEIDDYDIEDDDDIEDDEISISEEDSELDDVIAKSGKKGLMKRREIDDLLEQRRLERELRDEFDDDSDDDYDDFDEEDDF